jgi:probable F420-dependent oxidoreductase
MHVGIQFPSQTIGNDPAAVRGFAISAEQAGFHHLSYGEHIVWAVPGEGDARSTNTHHDVLTTAAYHAAITTRIQLFPALLVLPQRQAQLAAKQCAEVDLLSGGRLRVGVGVGSLEPEYAAMGANFHRRGRLIEEQIVVMRALWSRDWATFQGEFHHIEGASLGITPVQRPIPVWLGGGSDAVLERIGRMGDGWIATARPGDIGARVGRIRAAAEQAGRDPASIGIQGRIFLEDKTPAQWREEVEAWRAVGASHIDVRDGGLEPDAHIAQAVAFMRECGLAG